MTIKYTLTWEDGRRAVRSGFVKSVTEFVNPGTTKAYGMDLSIIFNDFQAAVIKETPPVRLDREGEPTK